MIYILNVSARLLVNHCVQSPWKDLNLKKRMLCTNFTVIHLYQNVCVCIYAIVHSVLSVGVVYPHQTASVSGLQ